MLTPCLFFGTSGCEDRAVPAGGELWLLPKEPPQTWVMLEWKVTLDSGTLMVIVRVSKDKDPDYRNRFPGRATFLPETLSLRIRPVTQADSGNYYIHFETPSGLIHSQCLCPVPLSPFLLETPRSIPRDGCWCSRDAPGSLPGISAPSAEQRGPSRAPGSPPLWGCLGTPSPWSCALLQQESPGAGGGRLHEAGWRDVVFVG